MSGQLKITKRHLPHWTIDGSTYFVTFRAYTTFTQPERKIVLDHLLHGNNKYYVLIAAVVMPDHAHILVFPNEGLSLAQIMKGIKGVSARKINISRNTNGQIWQHESYDHIIRNEKDLKNKFYYIANNPVKAELIEETHEYVGWYCNDQVHI